MIKVDSWILGQAIAGLLLTHILHWLLIRTGVLGARSGHQLLVLVLLKVGLSVSYYGVVAGLAQLLPPPTSMFSLSSFKSQVLKSNGGQHGISASYHDVSTSFMDGLRIGLRSDSIDNKLSRSTWSHYTFVWLLGYFLIVAAERRIEAELQRTRAEADRSRTELELLHSQINPHFLFNTLNSIRTLALIDSQRTRTALTQLADLLRYYLRQPGSGSVVIPLGEELAAVRDYLALEQTRFGPERLRVSLDVPEVLLAWPVPPAALLTLVENAIKHGISVTPDGGHLRLHACQQDAHLIITVSQPGYLAVLHSRPSVGTGIGLIIPANACGRYMAPLLILFWKKAHPAL